MLEQGCTYEQIAVEFAQRWGFRPRQAWREAYGWTQGDVADSYNQLRDDDQAAMTGRRISDYENWPHSGKKPTYKTLSVLAKIYSTSPSKLVDHYDRQKMTADERIALESQSPASATVDTFSGGRANQSRQLSLLYFGPNQTLTQTLQPPSSVVSSSAGQNSKWSVCDLIMFAADQSRHHAESAQGHLMPQTTLEEATAEVERLAREQMYTDPLTMFPDTIQIRDSIYRLLEQRQYPNQTTHLYYLASIVCALLADQSEHVGLPRAAWDQAQASWMYAEIIGHNSLRLWSRRKQAGLAFWGKRPQRALQLALSATEWATEPLGRADLYNSIACYSALNARYDESRTALTTAREAHESSTGTSEFHDRLGGVFRYPRAKLLQVAAMTYLELGDLDNVENAAVEAGQLYESGPAEQRAYGSEALARIDLGQARLARGEVEGVEDALQLVLSLPPAKKIDAIEVRLKDFHTALRHHRIGASPQGQQLGSEIENFFDTTAAHGFPRSDGG